MVSWFEMVCGLFACVESLFIMFVTKLPSKTLHSDSNSFSAKRPSENAAVELPREAGVAARVLHADPEVPLPASKTK